MAIGRYSFASRLYSGKSFGTTLASARIHSAVENRRLPFAVKVATQGMRLDALAGEYYGDSSYWWIIAAASGIGWGLQIPPGTILRIPTNIAQVLVLMRTD